MKVGDVVVELLSTLGCSYVFGIPGVHNLDIYRALIGHSGIRHILAKQEGNAAIMADVYGRLTGEPGVVLTTAGPGATNCVTAIAQAYASASPLIHISGYVPTRSYRWALHGLDSDDFLLNVFKPVTKWAARVRNVADIIPTLIKAYETATTGRMGPVHIGIPIDVLMSEYEAKLPQIPKPKRWCETAGIDDNIVSKLLVSRRLVIYAGKNASRYQCEDELIELCEVYVLRSSFMVEERVMRLLFRMIILYTLVLWGASLIQQHYTL